jgi:hypothetical protein
MFKRLISLALAGALSLGLITAAPAAQGTGCLPTTGTVSGLSFAQGVNAAIAALISSNSGASAPSTDCTAVPIKGQVWLDSSVSPNVLKQYDGTSWVLLGALDSANHLWAPPVGGGAATLTAAATTDLWSSTASSITVNGTTGITALANGTAVPGTVKVVTAGAAFTMTHNATSLELPGSANITVASGDRFLAIAKTSSNVAVFAYTKADGSAITNPSVPIGTILYGMWGTIPVKTMYATGTPILRASYPGYVAAYTRVQTGTLTSGNATITNMSNYGGLGAGMPLEGTGIQAGTTIVSVSGSNIVMSKTATTNGSQVITTFMTGYGYGGDTTTIGLPECRGRTMAGRDDQGIGAAGTLTTSYFGTGAASPYRIAGVSGAESRQISQSHLPAINLSASTSVALADPGHAHTTIIGGSGFTVPSGSGFTALLSGGGAAAAFASQASVTGITASATTTVSLGGSNILLPTVQPTAIAECVVVVSP